MVVPWGYGAFLAVLALERIVELVLSKINADRAFAHGGLEVGQRHFVAMKLLHTGFFVAAAVEVVWLQRPWIPWLGGSMLALALGAQALRYWAIASLGTRWNTRVIVVPGMRAVMAGPYRWVRHPNYVAVVVEMFAVPLVHSAYITAAAFTLLNAWLLIVRIRCEESALRTYCAYDSALAARHG